MVTLDLIGVSKGVVSNCLVKMIDATQILGYHRLPHLPYGDPSARASPRAKAYMRISCGEYSSSFDTADYLDICE